MYLKLFFYRLKAYLRNPSLYFWQLCFPFILGTLFFVAFGSQMNGSTEKMNPIPIALVNQDKNQSKEAFFQMIEMLEGSEENSNAVLLVTHASMEEAKTLLEKKEIDAIITVDSSISLTVLKSGLNQTILKNIIDVYQRKEAIILEILENNPNNLSKALEQLEQNEDFLKEISFGDTSPNPLIQYFYALVAMACLFCCYYGLTITNELQGNLSAIAARRCMTPSKKVTMLMLDFLAALCICFTGILLLFAYLIGVLKVDFGNQLLLTLFTSFIGCMFGLALGMFIGGIIKKNMQVKISICTAVSLFLSFLSGLMLNIMPDILETYCPIINRINPATLLADSFYCLSFYNNYKTFTSNLLILVVYTIVLCIANAWMLRRRKYASL